MATSPSPPSSDGSGSLYAREPTLEDLVELFVASKRSLNSTTTLWRADEIVKAARQLLEENAVLSAKNSFLRCSLDDQIDNLEAVRRGVDLVEGDVKNEFKNLLHSLDTSFSGLQASMTTLRETPISPALQPPDTPQKYLYDFIDSTTVTALKDSLRACIDRYNDALSTLHDTTDAFDDSLGALHATITALPQTVTTNSAPSPLPNLFHDLEVHATEAANCFASLVQHYDLCVTALKHTEGGGEAASAATNSTADPINPHPDPASAPLQTSTFASPPEPLTSDERLEMLAVVQKDAAEVDDVVTEIRDRGAEMEYLLSSISAHMTLLREERAALAAALHTLDTVARSTRAQLTAAKDFIAAWNVEHAAIVHGIDEWESLREFYEAFDVAYNNLIIEIAARRSRHERAKKKAKEAQRELDALYDEDVAAREAFTAAQGDFLPLDIWPGLRDRPRRFEVCAVGPVEEGDEEEGKSIPDVGREVLEMAVERVRERG
ncbi:hypothetical protein BU16DRAFT_513935 [Lophium mytilinum]|uniref:Autophagy-related protein 17 n=1 Tax=Lophium mytilinum TaxID=390894 RepID=A0A6A6QKD9_9PEZI|nr:hypothetical protein BU16DRAFT_513935 [Lophium mytilinum]